MFVESNAISINSRFCFIFESKEAIYGLLVLASSIVRLFSRRSIRRACVFNLFVTSETGRLTDVDRNKLSFIWYSFDRDKKLTRIHSGDFQPMFFDKRESEKKRKKITALRKSYKYFPFFLFILLFSYKIYNRYTQCNIEQKEIALIVHTRKKRTRIKGCPQILKKKKKRKKASRQLKST